MLKLFKNKDEDDDDEKKEHFLTRRVVEHYDLTSTDIGMLVATIFCILIIGSFVAYHRYYTTPPKATTEVVVAT